MGNGIYLDITNTVHGLKELSSRKREIKERIRQIDEEYDSLIGELEAMGDAFMAHKDELFDRVRKGIEF